MGKRGNGQGSNDRRRGLDRGLLVRPSTPTDSPASGPYVLGIDRLPKGRRILREDVA